MAKRVQSPGQPMVMDDRKVAQAFQRVCARLVQVSADLVDEAVVNGSPMDSPFYEDIDWIVDHVGAAATEALGEAYGEHVRNHRGKVSIASEHVRAMKLLAKHMASGYQVASSHARAVLLSALSLHYLTDAELSAEARVCRFAAHLLEQGSYEGRLGGVIATEMPGVEAKDSVHPQQRVTDLLVAGGFKIERNKRRHFIQAITWGDTRVEVKWLASQAARDHGPEIEFSWFLTSGAAHVEPWATNNFNSGTVDFYGTMAQASLIPAFMSMAEDVGGYFGVDTTSHVRRIEEAETAFGKVMVSVLDRKAADLPEDDPFGQMLRRGRDHRLRLDALLHSLPGRSGLEELAGGDGTPGLPESD